MNFLQITHCDQLNGEGNRVVLWVAGCSHRCKGCQNAYSQDPNIGVKFDDKAKEEIFKDLNTDWCAGITFSGGDPLFINNR
jgi:anaerobic ribonucleoside-triphosphate reductase activating protein